MTVEFSIANASLFDSKIVLTEQNLNKQYTLDTKKKVS